jgi:response regulator RpfG family c-di-GMP phosphodiesterase
MTDEFEKLKDKDFDDYLRKPVSQSALFEGMSRFLNYNEVETQSSPELAIKLSQQEQAALTPLLNALAEKMEQWQRIQSTNDLSDMQGFGNDLLVLAEQYQFKILAEYAQGLLSKIEVFDIKGIDNDLKAFSDLYTRLSIYEFDAD